MSLYADLNLTGPGVSHDEIKSAFRKISLSCHPDKKGNEEKYKQIVAAYEVLRDPAKKLEYDKSISTNTKTPRGTGETHEPSTVPDLVDLSAYVYHHLRRAYSSLGRSGPHTKSPPTRDVEEEEEAPPVIEQEIHITLEDLYNCTKKRLKITKQEVCTACDGQGGTQKKCGECNGQYKICGRCDMKGFQLDPVCAVCSGKQYTTVPKYLTINLAPGIDPDVPIDIKGVVDKNSLLRIYLVELPHPKYQRGAIAPLTPDWAI